MKTSVAAAHKAGEKLTGGNRFILCFAGDNVSTPERREVALLLWRIERGVKSPGSRAQRDPLDVDGNIADGIDCRRRHSTLLSRFWQLPLNPYARPGRAAIDGFWS